MYVLLEYLITTLYVGFTYLDNFVMDLVHRFSDIGSHTVAIYIPIPFLLIVTAIPYFLFSCTLDHEKLPLTHVKI